jgi:hypothetical protein
MRFQTTETVPTGDVEQVLRALETCLRENFDAVEREGRQIVLHGLGPSPKARNYRDTTIFEVVSNKGKTTIHADVTFQASALLGTSSQDSVVLDKLDSAFEQMRTRLNLGQAEIPAPRVRHKSHEESLRADVDGHIADSAAASAEALPKMSVAQVESEPAEFKGLERFKESGHSKFSRAKAVAAHVEEPSVATLPEEASAPPVLAPPPVEPVVMEPLVMESQNGLIAEHQVEDKEETPSAVSVTATEPITDESAEVPAIEPAPEITEPVQIAEPVPEVPVVVLESTAPTAPAPPAPPQTPPSSSGTHSTVFGQLASRLDSGMRRRASLNREGAEPPTLRFGAAGLTHKTGVPLLIVSILAVVVAAGSVYLYWAGLFNLDFAHRIISHAEPVAPTPPPPAIVPPQAPPPPPRHEEANPKLWLEEWVDALRGRDPELQASFYADPVNHYLGDANVSKDALTTEFRSAVQARDGLWTVKLENISVNPLASDHVLIRLTKHFMHLDDSGNTGQIADRYVKSRLELRKIDGEWKIVSEQDQAAANGR